MISALRRPRRPLARECGAGMPSKKPGRRNLEHEREFDQAAGADAIDATLVLFNVLEGQAHPLRQVTLGKSHQLRCDLSL